jgi:hypothetical protein
MMLTLRLTDILLMLLTAFACAAALYAIALMRRMNAMLDDWRKTATKLDEVLPHVQRLCTTSEGAMRSVHELAGQGTRVVEDVAEVTGEVREVIEDGLARLHGIMGALDTFSVLATSFKAGLAAVQARSDCEKDSEPEEIAKETEDEKRDL